MATPARGTFEWVAGWEVLAPLLSPEALSIAPDAHAVDIGCGNSTLPLHLASFYQRVTALDRDDQWFKPIHLHLCLF